MMWMYREKNIVYDSVENYRFFIYIMSFFENIQSCKYYQRKKYVRVSNFKTNFVWVLEQFVALCCRQTASRSAPDKTCGTHSTAGEFKQTS